MSPFSRSIIAGLVIGSLGVVASVSHLGQSLEQDFGLQFLFKLRGERYAPEDTLIVSLDKQSFLDLNLPTPADLDNFPRSLHAKLTDFLSEMGVAVIAYDLFFRSETTAEDDKLFSIAIRNAGNVLLTAYLEPQKGLNPERIHSPIPILADSALGISPFPLPRQPSKVSQYWVVKREAGDIPSFPVSAFQIYALDVYDDFMRAMRKVSQRDESVLSQLSRLPQDKDAAIKRGIVPLIPKLKDLFRSHPHLSREILKVLHENRSLLADTRNKSKLMQLALMYGGNDDNYLNIYGPPGTIATIPYSRLIQASQRANKFPANVNLKGKAVFIGCSRQLRAESVDEYQTSYGVKLRGIEIAATAFSNLIEGMPLKPIEGKIHLFAVFLWGIVLGCICFFLTPSLSAASLIILSALYVGLAHFQFTINANWHPIVVPIALQMPLTFFGAMLLRYRSINRGRRNIEAAFGKYIPPKLVNKLARERTTAGVDKELVHGTCLFTDAEDHTSLLVEMGQREYASFVDSFFETIFEQVIKHGGEVRDFKADEVMSLWATAHPDAALRKDACLAALDIAQAIRCFNESSEFRLNVRIGMHSGQILIGDVGALNRYEYRAIGEVINAASRVENLNKQLGTRILVTDEVICGLDSFLTRKLGNFSLRGLPHSFGIHELMCRKEEATRNQENLCELFSRMLLAWQDKAWDRAINILNEGIEVNKEGMHNPSKYYRDRCLIYKENPPGDLWNGTIQIESK